MPTNWSTTITERRLVGDFEPPAKAGKEIFSVPRIPDLIKNPEIAVVIQRDIDGTREVVRRLIDAVSPVLIRDAEHAWIEPLAGSAPGTTVERPQRDPDFALHVRDRITHILCTHPQAGAFPIDDMMDRIARVLARTDRSGKDFGELVSAVAAAIGTERSGIDAHRLVFADGSMVLYPDMNDEVFLEAVSLQVGSRIELPAADESDAPQEGLGTRIKRWWKRKRGGGTK